MTDTTHTTEADRKATEAKRSTAHPDQSPPPSSPAVDQDALDKGIEKLESVKAY